jgi:ABC-type transport system involved in cytochrome bd biosynthesis fused ATPase/permease subunit
MNATTLTTIVGLIITAIGTIGFPLFMGRSRARQSHAAVQAVDSRQVAQMFREERDRLQKRLDIMAGEYEKRITDLSEHYQRQLSSAEQEWRILHERDQRKISELSDEVQRLYRRLYQLDPMIGPNPPPAD